MLIATIAYNLKKLLKNQVNTRKNYNILHPTYINALISALQALFEGLLSYWKSLSQNPHQKFGLMPIEI
jgi:hypothetical protein